MGVAALLPLAGCASFSMLRCMPGEEPAVRDLLFLGTDRPDGGRISATEWGAFLRDVVTPRFPAGLTVWPASGQWRTADGSITREASYVLQLVQ